MFMKGFLFQMMVSAFEPELAKVKLNDSTPVLSKSQI